VVSTHDFITQLNDVNSGTSMLLGPVLDSHRAASILKNLHSLHLRMRQHSANAARLAAALAEHGLPVHYPGLAAHPNHDLMTRLMNPGFGYGGVLTVDAGSHERAARLMVRLQERRVGYLAVSLGYFKTLFSAPGASTSSEIPAEARHAMGLTDGLIRFSVGLDNDIQRGITTTLECVDELDRELAPSPT
jgi:methionine-gamma-lyase